MPRIKDAQYIYAVSRVRVIENSLLGQGEMDRMLEVGTPKEALKVLLDAQYGQHTSEPVHAGDYERLLGEEHKKLYRLLKSMAPDPGVFDLFLQPQDFHNVKVILKAEFADMEDFDALLTDRGTIKREKLKAMIRDRKLNEMPGIMQLAVEEAMEEFHHTRDPQTVDLILDRACYRQMGEIANSFNHPFLKDFVAGTVDFLNLDIFLRLKQMKKDVEFVQRTLLPGGTVPLRIWIEKTNARLDELAAVLKYTPYREAAGKMLESYRPYGSMAWLERLREDFIMIFIKKGRAMISGVEPLVGYLLAKENEIWNARMIMMGKMNRVSDDRIRRRLRRVYA